MDNPGHAPLLFDLHRNHKTLAPNSDEFVLYRSAFRQPPQVAAQRFLNHALLFLDIPANAGKLGRGPILQCPIRLNLVAETPQEFGEICNAGGDEWNGCPFLHRGRRAEGDLTPLCGAVHHKDHIANFRGFKRRSGNAGLLNQLPNIQQSRKFEAATNPAKLANLAC